MGNPLFYFRNKFRKEDRADNAPDLAQKLMQETGYDQETINQVVQNYVKTGEFNLPRSMAPDVQGPLAPDQVRESETNQMRKPIYTRDESSGQWGRAPQAVGDTRQVLEVGRTFAPPREPAAPGAVWKQNKVTGAYERMEGATSRDKVVGYGMKPTSATNGNGSGGRGGGSARQTLEEEAAMKAYQTYLTALKEGKLTTDVEEQGVSAAKFLGVPLEDVTAEKNMGWGEKMGRAMLPNSMEDKAFGSKVVSYQRPKFEERQELPDEALVAVRQAGGRGVTFANGQKWVFREGKAVRVK